MIQKTCDKAVNTYHFTLQFVPDSCKSQEICYKAINRCFLAFAYIPNR